MPAGRSVRPAELERLLDRTLHAGQRFAHRESEFCVQRGRAIVVSRLNQTHSRELPLGRTRHDSLHQLPTCVPVLDGGINGDRTHTGNRCSLVQAVAAYYLSVLFNHNAKERRCENIIEST
jgi:hypothetical protein